MEFAEISPRSTTSNATKMVSSLKEQQIKDKPNDSDRHVSTETEDEHLDHLHAVFRQHFEINFKPLEGLGRFPSKVKKAESEHADDSFETEWEGLSDDERTSEKIVKYHLSNPQRIEIPSEELKSFMVGAIIPLCVPIIIICSSQQTFKPPVSTSSPQLSAKPKKPPVPGSEEDTLDAANLKNDFALQRLLKESHLLDPKASLSLSVQNRHKALDLRFQEVGSKSSIYAQRNMPFSQRKGIARKAAGREERRRRDAKENGIILEKASRGKTERLAKRQRAIGTPSVGTFKGGMLTLSKKDVAEIEGSGKGQVR